PADASRVMTAMATQAVPSAAKRPSSTTERDCGVASTSSRRPSCSSADQRLTWVTAHAIKKSGRKKNIALKKPALTVTSPPPRFLMRFVMVGEPDNNVDSLDS